MKKLLFTLIVFFAFVIAHGQTKNNEDVFSFIESSSDTSSLKFIQTISRPGIDFVSLYETIKKRAQEKGANCFKLKKFTRDSTGEMTLTLDTYFGNDSFLFANHKSHEKNTVYIISDGEFNNNTYSFTIDGVNEIIKSGTYYKYTITKGGKVKINKGGFLGTTGTIVWEENKLPTFLTLSGFGVSGIYVGQGIGVAFKTGGLKSIDASIGFLAIIILNQQQ